MPRRMRNSRSPWWRSLFLHGTRSPASGLLVSPRRVGNRGLQSSRSHGRECSRGRGRAPARLAGRSGPLGGVCPRTRDATGDPGSRKGRLPLRAPAPRFLPWFHHGGNRPPLGPLLKPPPASPDRHPPSAPPPRGTSQHPSPRGDCSTMPQLSPEACARGRGVHWPQER